MKSLIIRLHLSHLHNSEYPIFVSQLVLIAAKQNPELLHLKKSFDRLEAILPDVAKIKSQELSNVLTKSLRELDAERATLLTVFVSLIKTMGRLSLPSVVPHIVVMKRFLSIHGRDIAKANYSSATARTQSMLDDYDAKPEFKTAIQALNLKIIIDELQKVNTQFTDLFLQRFEEEAIVEKVNSRAIRKETDQVLNSFFDAFEFCSSEYDELDYVIPAKELNELITHYKTLLKARNTRSKTKRKQISSNV